MGLRNGEIGTSECAGTRKTLFRSSCSCLLSTWSVHKRFNPTLVSPELFPPLPFRGSNHGFVPSLLGPDISPQAHMGTRLNVPHPYDVHNELLEGVRSITNMARFNMPNARDYLDGGPRGLRPSQPHQEGQGWVSGFEAQSTPGVSFMSM